MSKTKRDEQMPWRMIAAFWAYWGVVFFITLLFAGIVLPLSLMIAASGEPATIGEGIGELMQGALAAVLLYLVAIALSVFVSRFLIKIITGIHTSYLRAATWTVVLPFFLMALLAGFWFFSCSLLGADQAIPAALSFLSPLPLGAILGKLFWAHSKDQT